MKYLLLCLLLIACVSKYKPEYQNNFYVGCMNAFLHFESDGPVLYKVREDQPPFSYELRYADYWCKDTYARIKDK